MVDSIHVEGFDAFMTEVAKHDGKTVFVLFSGSSENGGESWCSDCVTADPVIENYLKFVDYDLVFIHCGVGGRDFWKDKKNIFRTNSTLKLKSVPTLLKWGTPMRLEEDQCASVDLLEELFEE